MDDGFRTAGDDDVGARLARHQHIAVESCDWVLEGGAIGEVTMWAFGRDEALVTFEGADADIELLGSVVRSL